MKLTRASLFILRVITGCACLASATFVLAVCGANLGPSATPTSDFVIHSDGTATHKPTGLMWKTCAEGLSDSTCTTGVASRLTWSDALTSATVSTFAGYTDWRLPNKQELESLVDDTCINPAINDTVFPGSPLALMWSSSTQFASWQSALLVDFTNGQTAAVNKRDYLFGARLVRSGQSYDAEALIPPAGRITGSPADGYETSATFTFTSSDNQGTVRHLCSLDGAPISACTSPISYTGLLPGSHRFVLLSYDPVFNFDPNPPIVTWNVLPRPVPTLAPVLLALLSTLVALLAVSCRARFNAAKR
jgi:hypothetical protein